MHCTPIYINIECLVWTLCFIRKKRDLDSCIGTLKMTAKTKFWNWGAFISKAWRMMLIFSKCHLSNTQIHQSYWIAFLFFPIEKYSFHFTRACLFVYFTTLFCELVCCRIFGIKYIALMLCYVFQDIHTLLKLLGCPFTSSSQCLGREFKFFITFE